MENNAIPVAPIDANTKKLFTGSRWKRELVQLTGKSGQSYIHGDSRMLMQSYAKIGGVPHGYHTWEEPCSTDIRQFGATTIMAIIYYGTGTPDIVNAILNTAAFPHIQRSLSSLGVSALEFDTKGRFLVSVTRSGCLTVHEYDSLYSLITENYQEEDEDKQHVSVVDGVSSVCWNPFNQDEVAYTSLRNDKLTVFDIEHSEAVRVLRKRPPVGVLVREGLSDVAFLNDGSRVLASDKSGEISMWDRRVSDFPQMVLTSENNVGLTSIQLLGDQLYVCGASKNGFIYTWDLRCGRSSDPSQIGAEARRPPLTSVNLESMLNNINGPLKPQANMLRKEIQSININPACSYQLGFHLADGCSGVLDMLNSRVSHIHCPPPPPWLLDARIPVLPSRRPTWLLDHSIYAAPSASSNGVHLLDFYPHRSSPCHVDYDDSENPRESVEHKQSSFVRLSARATACATHPLEGNIFVGTMGSSLLMIAQKLRCKKGDGDK